MSNFLHNLAAGKGPGFFELSLRSAAMVGLRYMLFAGMAWLLCYVLFRRRWLHRKIVACLPASGQVWREIRYSALTLLVFGIVTALTLHGAARGWTQMYWKIGQHSQAWFWLSIACAILLHDTWFYWTHRAMHHPRVFRWVHRVHHLSHNPTPWAAYAFSPLEALLQAAIFPLTVVLMPMHPYAFGLFMLWQIVFNVAGHTGYEFHPRWLMKTPLRFLINTPTNHIMHHETLRGNYGLYFNFWDRLMGTNHARYEERFCEVTSQKRKATPE